MNYCFVFGHEPWLLPPALELIDVIVKSGNSVDVIYAEYTSQTVSSDDYNSSYTFEVIRKEGRLKHYLKHAFLAAAIRKLEKKKKIDVIIACDLLPLHALVSISTKAKRGYWCFEEPHQGKNYFSIDYYRKKKLAAWIGKMDFLLMPSETRQRALIEKLKLSLPSLVIYNCKQLSNRSKKIQNKFPQYDKVLVYSGKISPSQFVEEIVDAMALVDNRVGLILAGIADEEYLNNILEKINRENRNHNVTYIGRVSREEVYDLIDLAEIGFVLYGKDNEGNEIDPAPNKLGDYIAGQTWVIGSGQDYLKYWLDEKGAGVTVDTINKENLANAVNFILSEKKFSDKTVLNNIYRNELNMNSQYEKLKTFIETI